MSKGWFKLAVILVLVAMVFAVGCGTKQAEKKTETPVVKKEPVKIGGIFDLTGGTGDVGTPYAEGVKSYIGYVNSKGGVNGREIQLIDIDYAYKIPQAVEAYKKLTSQDKVVAIMGWGTGDTEAMVPFISKDKIPYMSGSYSESLLNVETHPYNFMVAASYSDQIRLALQWMKDNWTDTTRNPRVAFIYSDTGFGRSPIEDGRAFAAKIGVDLVDEQIVDLRALDATSQLMNMQKKQPDFAVIQQTSNATATILKDAKKLGLNVQFVGLNWAADEVPVKLAGEAAEGYVGVIPFAFPVEVDTIPAMKEIRDYVEATNGFWAKKNQKFIQGWVSAMVMVEGIKRAGDNVTGETIKAGLETLDNFDLGGLASPVSFSSSSHRGGLTAMLYQVKDGVLQPISDWIPVPKVE